MRTIMRTQKEKQDFIDRESTIKWLCSLGTLNAFLLLVPLFGNSWCMSSAGRTGSRTSSAMGS